VNSKPVSNQDAFTVAGYRAASLFAKLTPGVIAHASAFALSGPLAIAMRSKRLMVERHLRRINPTLSGFALRQATQEAFQSYARYYLETFRLSTLSRRQIDDGFKIEGFDHIERAVAAGKGTVLALPHLGGWEWSGRWLVDQGYGLTAVVEKLANDDLFEWFLEMRTRVGFDIIPLDDGAGLKVNEALRGNKIVSLLCDRDIVRDGERAGVQVQFFGEQTTVPAGPAFFALRTGAALIPLATYFTKRVDGHFTVVRPPIPVSRQGSLREDVARITQLLTTEIELLIRRAPEQWHLFQPNWPSDPGYQGMNTSFTV
jgi:KDO2-lipid IV(A) lauroyltransferase